MQVDLVRLSAYKDLLSAHLLGCWATGEDRPYLFLLIHDGASIPRLVIGDVQPHSSLLIFSDLPEDLERDEKKKWLMAKQQDTKSLVAKYLPIVVGGGTCDAEGNVVDWKTITFKLETDEMFRPQIQTSITRIVQTHFLNTS